MAVNKVEANGETLIDLTSDTVTADTLLSGRTAHLASGEKVTGTFEPVTGVKGNAESAYRKGNVNLTPANIGAATSEQGAKADSAVQTIQISGTTQTKTGGTVNLPAYPTKSSLGLGNVDNTSDANKPISTAAQAALDKQQAQIDYNTNQGVKNLCKITAESQTINGVTFTVDKVAGTITANGTATAQIAFRIGDYISSILQVGNKYTLSGCPAGGNYTSTYALYVFNASTGSTVWADVGLSGGSSYVIPSDIRLSPLYILIRQGVTVSNIVFKPMIRYASIKDNTFEPYAMSNVELTQKALIPKVDNNHNGIFRGKDLTNVYTIDQMYSMIHGGNFDDLFLGDYFTVSITTTLPDETVRTENVTLMIAAFDYYYNIGDTALTTHHIVLIPRNQGFATTAKMNETNTTEGGYLNSAMHQTVLPCYADSLKTALNNHLLSHSTMLTNKVTTTAVSMAGAGMTGSASGWEWATVELQLMNEVQLYGSTVWSSSAYDVGVDYKKLPVFDFINGVQYGRGNYWLRSVVNSTSFAFCGGYGSADYAGASYLAYFVRPLILFG